MPLVPRHRAVPVVEGAHPFGEQSLGAGGIVGDEPAVGQIEQGHPVALGHGHPGRPAAVRRGVALQRRRVQLVGLGQALGTAQQPRPHVHGDRREAGADRAGALDGPLEVVARAEAVADAAELAEGHHPGEAAVEGGEGMGDMVGVDQRPIGQRQRLERAALVGADLAQPHLGHAAHRRRPVHRARQALLGPAQVAGAVADAPAECERAGVHGTRSVRRAPRPRRHTAGHGRSGAGSTPPSRRPPVPTARPPSPGRAPPRSRPRRSAGRSSGRGRAIRGRRRRRRPAGWRAAGPRRRRGRPVPVTRRRRRRRPGRRWRRRRRDGRASPRPAGRRVAAGRAPAPRDGAAAPVGPAPPRSATPHASRRDGIGSRHPARPAGRLPPRPPTARSPRRPARRRPRRAGRRRRRRRARRPPAPPMLRQGRAPRRSPPRPPPRWRADRCRARRRWRSRAAGSPRCGGAGRGRAARSGRPPTSSPTASTSSGPSSSRSPARSFPGRAVASTSSGPRWSATQASHASVVASATSASSTTSNVGWVGSSPHMASITASNQAARSDAVSVTADAVGQTSRAGPAAARRVPASVSDGGIDASASSSGCIGRSRPSSSAWATSTRPPRSPTWRAKCSTSAVLPMPASPSTTTTRPVSALAR